MDIRGRKTQAVAQPVNNDPLHGPYSNLFQPINIEDYRWRVWEPEGKDVGFFG